MTFRICTGNLKPTKVCVRIFDLKNQHFDVECKASRQSVVWTSPSVKLLKKDFQYTYIIHLLPTSDWKLVKAVKQTLMTAAPHFEPRFRTLPSYIDEARDIFEPPGAIKVEPLSIYMGLVSNLQSLLDNVKTIDDLKQKLSELEHVYRAVTPELVNDRNVGIKLRAWIEKALGSYFNYPHKVVFLSALYGRLAKQLSASLCKTRNITEHGKKQIPGALQNAERNELTKWSLVGIRETALQALEATNHKHWVYVAAHFAHIFELSRVMDQRRTLNDATLDINALEKVLIPKIKEGYQADEADAILLELPKSAKTADQKTKLTELVQQFITKPKLPDGKEKKPPQEPDERVTSVGDHVVQIENHNGTLVSCLIIHLVKGFSLMLPNMQFMCWSWTLLYFSASHAGCHPPHHVNLQMLITWFICRH